MKYAIRYYSKTGNTEKLANSISDILHVPAYDISRELEEDVDILFFGSGVYGSSLEPGVIKYLSDITVKVGKIVSFSTSGIMESNYPLVKEVIANTSLNLADEEFHCPGTFVNVNQGRPNDDDMEKFKKFVNQLIGEK